MSNLEFSVVNALLLWSHHAIFGPYTVDFAREDIRMVIEVQGCYWHDCQICFPGDHSHDSNKNWERSKASYFKNRGWIVLYLWEHDIDKLGPEKAIEKLFKEYALNEGVLE